MGASDWVIRPVDASPCFWDTVVCLGIAATPFFDEEGGAMMRMLANEFQTFESG